MPSQRVYPQLTLCEYVSAYILSDYGVDGFVDDTACIYPEGSAILCFSLDNPFVFKEISSGCIIKLTKFNFIPQFKQPRFYQVIACPGKVLHVIFKPYGAYKLLGISQNTSFDEHGTSLFDMLADKIKPLLNQIEDAAYNTSHIIQLVNKWLENQLVKNEKIDVSRVSYACMLIAASQGNMPIKQLTQNMHISKRALEYQFQEQVGLSPKLYSRITRFSFLLTAIKNNKAVNWKELSFRHKFFDQAHLINEFKYFSGNSPTRLSEINPILTADSGL
jgi:AraC-like DNA-binding protein